MHKWNLIEPNENNGYCMFPPCLESNPMVFFHITPKRNLASITSSGFRSASDLGTGMLESVSFAKMSSTCLAHIGSVIEEDYVVFAVEFDSLHQQSGIKINQCDIHVYSCGIQPRILGYCEIPKGFRSK